MLTTRLMVSIDEGLSNKIQEIADWNGIKKAQAIRDALEQYVKVQIELHEAQNSTNKLLQYVGQLKYNIEDGLLKQRRYRLNGGLK